MSFHYHPYIQGQRLLKVKDPGGKPRYPKTLKQLGKGGMPLGMSTCLRWRSLSIWVSCLRVMAGWSERWTDGLGLRQR